MAQIPYDPQGVGATLDGRTLTLTSGTVVVDGQTRQVAAASVDQTPGEPLAVWLVDDGTEARYEVMRGAGEPVGVTLIARLAYVDDDHQQLVAVEPMTEEVFRQERDVRGEPRFRVWREVEADVPRDRVRAEYFDGDRPKAGFEVEPRLTKTTRTVTR